MKTTGISIILTIIVIGGVVTGEELSQDRQRYIIENYMYATGQRAHRPQAIAADLEAGARGPEKCGTPAILEFQRNYDKLDRALLSALGVAAVERPQLDFHYDSPGGEMRIHYDRTGGNAVYQADVDSNSDGVPDYVEAVALIADSCYDYMLNVLGYPPAIVDTAYDPQGDGRVDIYLVALSPGYYGLTYNLDTSLQHSPTFVVIDHDFQHLLEYVGRPLDAARVTLAHELFHTSHFAMDGTEDIAWFEMTAVWMEEQQYDDINDYYLLFDYFFDFPMRSLQSIINSHHYGSVLFPLYLSETYGVDIIRDIWLRASQQQGSSFLVSTDFVIDSTSRAICDTATSGDCDTADLATAFAEFAVWNFFTGPYARQAPNNIGYSEKENYGHIPLERMDLRRKYPVTVTSSENLFRPQHNAATYLRLDNLEAITSDTMLPVFFYAGPATSVIWSLSGILQLRTDPDSHIVITDTIDNCSGAHMVDEFIGTIDIRDYSSATMVFTPTTVAPGLYGPITFLELGYAVNVTSPGAIQAVLTPYPNPAVISEMYGAELTFRFEMMTDTVDFPAFGTAHLIVDVFNVAGERVRALENVFAGAERNATYGTGLYEIGWDMRNDAGKEIASGAYLAYAQLYQSASRTRLLAEDKVKVAVIR